jgi:toxin ParE1/3/4
MPKLIKRPIIIKDLMEIATYISYDNLDAGDRFLYAAEATFQLIARTPGIGRFSGFTN